jgi:hypothetical protein
MLHLQPRVGHGIEDVRVLRLAVVVERAKVVDHHGIAEKLCEYVAADQLRRDFLEEILLILVDFVGLAGGGAVAALVGGIGEGACIVEYFLVELLQIVEVQVWYLLHDAESDAGMGWANDFVDLHAEGDQRGLGEERN